MEIVTRKMESMEILRVGEKYAQKNRTNQQK